jgi:penicillin-binding protein 2
MRPSPTAVFCDARFTRVRSPVSGVRRFTPTSQCSEQTRISGLDAAALAAVRDGLRRVVDDPSGTAYDTVRTAGLPIAGKTGTAETGGNQADHAWFAGYAPADAPRWAFVVVLEHGGSGGASAGTLRVTPAGADAATGYISAAVAA